MVFYGCEKSGEINTTNTNYPYYIEAYLETGRYATAHISKATSLYLTQSVYSYWDTDLDSAIKFYNKFHALLLKDGVVVDSLIGPYDNHYNYWLNIDYNYDWWFLKGKNHLIKQGGNYQMVIKLAGHPNMTASCVVPQVIPIQSLDTVNNGQTWKYYPPQDSIVGPIPNQTAFQITFKDPPQQQNYYAFELYKINKAVWYNYQSTPQWISAGIYDNSIFDNHIINNTSWGYSLSQGIFNDKLFKGQEKSFVFTTPPGCDSLIAVNLVSISQGYYERLLTTYLFILNSINIYASPVPVYSNFSNAIGFLGGRTVASDTFNIITLKVQP